MVVIGGGISDDYVEIHSVNPPIYSEYYYNISYPYNEVVPVHTSSSSYSYASVILDSRSNSYKVRLSYIYFLYTQIYQAELPLDYS